MIMPDVNILVYAHRQDEKTHEAYRAWLEQAINGVEPFALSVLVAVAFVRTVTNPRIYEEPTPVDAALSVIETLAAHPRCYLAAPSRTHLGDVARLCRATRARGKLVADAQHAALAIAEGCTWVSRDGEFERFQPHGLRWEHLALA